MDGLQALPPQPLAGDKWRGQSPEGSLGGQGQLLCTPGLILTEALGGCLGSCDCQR